MSVFINDLAEPYASFKNIIEKMAKACDDNIIDQDYSKIMKSHQEVFNIYILIIIYINKLVNI